MWTYMMAAARGDRANSMMSSSRRRNEVESPKYGYNCKTSTLGSTYPYTTSTSHQHQHYGTAIGSQTPSRTTTTAAQQQQRHHIIGIDDVYTNPVTSESYEMEDGTSLFSPLTPTSTTMPTDTAVLIARKHLKTSQEGDHHQHPHAHLLSHHQPGNSPVSRVAINEAEDAEEHNCFVGSQAAVVRLPSRRTTITSTSSAFYQESDEDDEDDYGHGHGSHSSGMAGVIRHTKPIKLVIDHERRRTQRHQQHQQQHQQDINEDFNVSDGSDYDEEDADDEKDNDDVINVLKEANYNENIKENGKKLPQ
ncbi:hypothetical protein DOY81_011275, partial [Sarcophaga bullata]